MINASTLLHLLVRLMLLMKKSVLSFEEKNPYNLGLPTFKLSPSTKELLRLNR